MVTTTIYLIRHGAAGDREAWQGDDDGRPLTAKGRRQAEVIAKRLGDRPIGQVVSSPAIRCSSTVEPLAQRLGRSVEETDALSEGSDPKEAFAALFDLAEALGGSELVACSHGDVIGGIVEIATDEGATVEGELRLSKGITIELAITDDRIVSLRCVRAR